MKKTFQKLNLKKSKVSLLTSLVVRGGALPTTKQSTLTPDVPPSYGCTPETFSCYPDRCA